MHTRLILALLLLTISAHAAAPSNDALAHAKIITQRYGTLNSETTIGATAEFAEPMIGGAPAQRTVWYRFLSPLSGALTVQIPNGLGIRMTFFRSRGAGSFESLNPISSTTPTFPGVNQSLQCSVTAAFPVYLAVDSDIAGSFPMQYRVDAANNDFFEDALVLPGGQGTVSGENEAATLQAGEPPTPSGDTHTVWYSWSAPTGAQYSFDTIGSSSDTVLEVFSGSSFASLTPIAQNDNSSGLPIGAARVTFVASASTTYYIRISGATSGGGFYVLNYYLASSAGVFNIHAVGLNEVSNEPGIFPFTVRRVLGSAGTASVKVATSTFAGGAQAGVDFVGINQTLNFADGEVEKAVTIPILYNPANTTAPSFAVALSNPVSATIGSSGSLPVFCLAQQPAALEFASHFASLREGGHAQLQVIRIGDPSEAVSASVTYVFPAGSIREARGGLGAFVSVSLVPGQLAANLDIALPDDGVFEGAEDVTVTLTAQSTSSTATLHIVDADPIPARSVAYECVRPNDTNLSAYTFRAMITPAGLLTGQVRTNVGALAFKGSLVSGDLSTLVPRPNGLGDLSVQLTLTQGGANLHVRLVGVAGDFSDEFDVPALSTGLAATAGTYTFAATSVFVNGVFLNTPAYGGYTISPTGAVKGVGRLTDGQPFAFGSQLEFTGGIHALAAIRAGREIVAFTAAYNHLPASDFSGTFSWQKLPSKGDAYLPAGLQLAAGAIRAVRYTPPPAGTRVLASWQASNGAATLTLTGKGFGFTLPTAGLNVSTANLATFNSGTPPAKLLFYPKLGMFMGMITPSGHAAVGFGGIFYQGAGTNSIGLGNFITDGTPGAVTLTGP